MSERDELARLIRDTWSAALRGKGDIDVADAILESEWLKAHDIKVAATALTHYAAALKVNASSKHWDKPTFIGDLLDWATTHPLPSNGCCTPKPTTTKEN